MLAIASLGLLCVPAAAARKRPRATEAVRAGACGQRMLAIAAPVAITPDGDGTADCAVVRIRLERPSTVELVVAQRKPQPRTVHVHRAAAPRGLTTLVWTPGPDDRRADVRDAGDRHPSGHARHDRRPGDPRAGHPRAVRARELRAR